MSKKLKEPRASQNPLRAERTPKASPVGPKMRVPRAAPVTPKASDRLVRFCFSMCDHDSSWALHTGQPDQLLELLKKLSELEGMTWGEVERSSELCKSYGDMGLCPNSDAVKRLVENYEGLDNVSRFRLSGQQRLFGVRSGCDFFILWWDPTHEIWPSKKKHT